MNDYANVKRVCDLVSTHMAQCFLRKQKTKEYQKTQFKKTGILDTQVLFKHKLSEDLFIRRQVDHKGNSYGFVMLLDMSSSMSGVYLPCVIEIILLVKFCRKIGVPFEVYGFFDGHGSGPFYNNSNEGKSKLFNFFSSETNKADFENHCKAFYLLASKYCSGIHYSLGGTPMNAALYRTFDVIEKFDQSYNRDVNHLILLTDGDPTDTIFRNKTKGLLKVKNKTYYYDYDVVRLSSQRSPLVCMETEFLINTMKKHFGSKLKAHKINIRPISDRAKNMITRENNNSYSYDTESDLNIEAFSCFGNSIHSGFLSELNEEVAIRKVAKASTERTKIGKEMEKSLAKTSRLKEIAEKIVDLLVEV